MKIKPARQRGHVMVELRAGDSVRMAGTAEKKALAVSPFKLKKILVPLDFSDCSKKALQYAVPFARQFNARMIFLHVLPVHIPWSDEFELANYEPLSEEDLRKDMEARLTALVQETVPAEIPVEIEVRYGAPSAEILNVAREMDVDVIFISTHGHTSRIRAAIGSVAGDVVRLAPCPVLVVREHEREFIQNPSNPFKTGRKQPNPARAATVV
jgi:universal stress protein A